MKTATPSSFSPQPPKTVANTWSAGWQRLTFYIVFICKKHYWIGKMYGIMFLVNNPLIILAKIAHWLYCKITCYFIDTIFVQKHDFIVHLNSHNFFYPSKSNFPLINNIFHTNIIRYIINEMVIYICIYTQCKLNLSVGELAWKVI